MKKNAYTLIEVLIVVVIVSILAGLSVIYGTKPLEAAKAKAARAMLQTIYAAEKEYCIHSGSYTTLGTSSTSGTLLGERYIDNPNDPDQRDWNYTTPAPGASTGPNDCGTFTVNARRRGSGHNAGQTISIDQDGFYTCSSAIPEWGC